MDPQELSNRHLQVAAEHIAAACTSAHLVEDVHGQASLLVYRDKERIGTFDGGTCLYELLKGQLDPNDRQFRFRVDGMTYIGWAPSGSASSKRTTAKACCRCRIWRSKSPTATGRSATSPAWTCSSSCSRPAQSSTDRFRADRPSGSPRRRTDGYPQPAARCEYRAGLARQRRLPGLLPGSRQTAKSKRC